MADNQQINSNQFPEVYKGLGIKIDDLGCIMLDVDGEGISNIIQKEDLYITKDKKKFWINGFVAGETPHLTLLFGLLEQGDKYKKYVDRVLEGWSLNSVEIEDVSYFDSPYDNEDYYCIIAHIKKSDKLIEGHQRLQLLPHIDTFAGYKPHVTIAYIKKDEKKRDEIISNYEDILVGESLIVKGINYGGDK